MHLGTQTWERTNLMSEILRLYKLARNDCTGSGSGTRAVMGCKGLGGGEVGCT